MRRKQRRRGSGFGTFQGVFTPSSLTIIRVVLARLRRWWSRGWVAILLALSLGKAAQAGVLLPAPFSASVAPEYRSAYQARGLVIEDRPVAIVPVFLNADTGDFGTFGVWSRTLSSLTDRRDTVKSEAFYERDWAARWRFDWAWTETVSLWTDFDKVWMMFHSFRSPYRGKQDHTLNEWRIRQELRNPIITPFYYVRRCVSPSQTFYVQTGAFRAFRLTHALSVSPQFFVEMGNAGLMRVRYGQRTDGDGWRGGIQSLNVRLDLSWRVSDYLSFFTGVHEFVTVNEAARRCVKAKTSAWSRRDLTIFSCGAKFSF